ncbi:MAG: hypothetical protein R2822_31490 [Spirosomataceae bacterium]
MRKPFVFAMIAGVYLSACSTPDQEKKQQEIFEGNQPVAIDTAYHTDYVADISSIRNVEVRARVKAS